MIRNIALLFCGLLFFRVEPQAQSYELLSSYSQSEIATTASSFGVPSESLEGSYGVDMYRVSYEMPYLSDTIEVSGALFVPVQVPESCGLPLHVYMHGTIFKRTNAPSFMGLEGDLGALMSTLGQVVLMPDYVGLGISQLMHPYVHARSESDAGYFMMKAAAELASDLGYTLNGQNFISGYSQGGHAAMALARDLTYTNYGDDFPLSGAAPGSGPYDISGTQFPLTFDANSYSNPAYLAYNVVGWNSYYGTLFDELDEVFQEPYASAVLEMLDGTHDAVAINNVCPETLEEFIQPWLLDSIFNNPNHPFNLAAQDNDVHEWIPEAPVEMFYCTQDEQVFYQNALNAAEWMTENGSELHVATNLGSYDHGQCAELAIFNSTLWIQAKVDECSTAHMSEPSRFTDFFPNPASREVTLSPATVSTRWHVLNLATGQIVRSGQGQIVPVEDLASGMWVLHVEGHGKALLCVAH